MYVNTETGLLYFLLARSTHIVNAYKEGRDIVVSIYCNLVAGDILLYNWKLWSAKFCEKKGLEVTQPILMPTIY